MDNVSKLYLYVFLHNLTFFGAISVPFYIQWGKLTYMQMFLLEAWFIAWVFILEVPTGTIADKYGRKAALFFASLLSSAGALAFGTVPDFFVFMLGEFLMAAGVALASGADRAMLYDTLKAMKKQKESGHFFSRYAFFTTMSLVVAFPLGSLIAGSDILPYPRTLPLTFLLTAVPIFLSALVALTMAEPRRTKPKENSLKVAIKGVDYLMRHRTLRSFAIDMTLVSSTTFFIFWFSQPLLLNAGVGMAYLGFVAAAWNLVGALLLFRAREMERMAGMKYLLFLTALVPALAFIGLAVYHELWFILLGIFAIASLKLFRQPLFDSYLNKFIKSGDRATVLSAISMLQRIAMMVLYPMVGFVSDISIYHTLAMLGVITLVFALAARVDEKHLGR